MTEKTARELAAEEREKIKVTSVVAADADKDKIESKDDKKDEIEEKEDDEKDEKTNEELNGGNEEEDEEENEGNEEGEKVLQAADDPVKLKKTIERLQRRVDKLTAKNKLTETEKNELAVKVAAIADNKEVLTAEDVTKQANEIAEQTIAQRDFVNACNRLADKATKLDKTFIDKCNAMGEDIGPIPSGMIAILDDLPLGHAVLNYLTDNVDEAEKIYGLSPAKMAIELSKLENKVKKKPKELSKVPEPNDPIHGTARTDTILRDDEPMSDWVAKRNAQVAQRQEARRKGMR